MKTRSLAALLTLFCGIARADFTPTSLTNVDIEQGIIPVYRPLPENVVGSGTITVPFHQFSILAKFDLMAPLDKLVVSGSILHLRRLSVGGSMLMGDYAGSGTPAYFFLTFGVAQAPASSSLADVAASLLAAPEAGTAGLGNGLAPPGQEAKSPDFSVDLGPVALAAANAAFAAGRPLYLAISGGGVAGIPLSSTEGDLVNLSIVPEPASWALLCLGLVTLRRCSASRARTRA